jgi:DNA polymerase III subunit alpha
MEPFVHLHVHTEYSLLDGANRIPDLVQAAVDDGHDAIAITDHGNLFGSMEFYKACKKAEVKPILGCEMYIAQKSMREKHSRTENPYNHLTLLARDQEGWRNLHKLSSLAYLEGHHFRPRIDMQLLSEHAAGITCLSGCMSGPVNAHLRREQYDKAMQAAGELQDLFGKEHFFLEVMRNGMDIQDRLTEEMAKMVNRVDAPLVATNDIHYLRHEDCNAQDALLCIHTGSKLDDPNRWRMDTDTLFFRTREQMNHIFSDMPEALRNTQVVADQVNVEFEFGNYRLPIFDPPDGSKPVEYFRKLCEEGFARFYPGNPEEARKRLEYEMRVIDEMGFVTYFLITWDLIHHARSVGIPVGPGRGSAAGSIVAYCLEITRIDPLKYDLIFERFLNPGRVSMPDIDIDFCKDRREEMIAYTRQKYGDDRVCQIITFGKMKARAALRDVARVMDVPLKEVDQLVKKVPEGPGVKLSKAFDADEELQELRDISDRNKKWVKLATSLEGLSRHTSVHAAGVIIADEPLIDIVPLAMQDGNITTQWDMKISEQYGLLKMDFLGLRTLSILHEAVTLVKKRSGEEIDLDALELKDEATFELLQSGDTEGVFQLESGGMRRLLANLKPTTFEDVIAVLALYRPGPLGSGLHEIFARRKHGEEEIRYPHPLLEEILQETYGVLIYQEQIMRVAQMMGGFSLSEADSLRKAMGKKDVKLMRKMEPGFLTGAIEREVDEHVAKDIWEMMIKFAEYGFNKSHSAAYALVTYQAAWMKAHHPAEFYAASFTYEASDADKLATLIEDAKGHDLKVLPPCIHESFERFAVLENGDIRFGLEAIKGVGGGAAENVVQQRRDRIAKDEGEYPDFHEFLVECVGNQVNRSTVENLIKAGALDKFEMRRLDLLEDLQASLTYAQSVAKDRQRGQGMLFDTAPTPAGPAQSASSEPEEDADGKPPMRKLSDAERKLTLTNEKEALGLYLTQHPLDPYRDILRGIAAWDSRNLKEVGDNSQLALAGIAAHVKILPLKKDPSRKMARLRVEDLYGSTAALIWPSTLENHKEMVHEDFIGVFHGSVDMGGEEPVLRVDRIEPMAEKDSVKLSGSLTIVLGGGDPPIEKLQKIIREHPGGSMIRFVYQDSEGKSRLLRAGPGWRVGLNSGLFDQLNKLLAPTGHARAEADSKPAPKAEKPRWANAGN